MWVSIVFHGNIITFIHTDTMFDWLGGRGGGEGRGITARKIPKVICWIGWDGAHAMADAQHDGSHMACGKWRLQMPGCGKCVLSVRQGRWWYSWNCHRRWCAGVSQVPGSFGGLLDVGRGCACVKLHSGARRLEECTTLVPGTIAVKKSSKEIRTPGRDRHAPTGHIQRCHKSCNAREAR